jgi:uncharacterized protein
VGWGTKDASTSDAPYTLLMAAAEPIGGVIELPQEARTAGGRPSWLGYVGVHDVDAVAQRFKDLGGTVHIPPTDLPDASRFAVVADPQMAMLALLEWPNAEPPRSPEHGAPGRVAWNELLAADWGKAFVFYKDIFGWQKANAAADVVGTYQTFSVGGQSIGGMFTKPPSVPVAFWIYYFNVSDIHAAVASVRAGGGQVMEGPVDMPDGRSIARCIDPQGGMFAMQAPRARKPVGYFESVGARDQTRGRWSW